jgi:tetratricopeptide (TPR) repeat protein
VLDGLDADEAGRRDSALVLYERALQVDPINPYAYLAIARHRVEGEDPESALPFLDKAETLLESRGELSLGAEAHITGLRGTVLLATGRRSEAFQHFEEARTLDPLTWSDGRLSPSELR